MDFDLLQKINKLYLTYSEVISDDRLEEWPELFVENCFYRLTNRLNFDRQLPLGVIRCESRGALVDRVTAIRNTMVYAPRHIVHTFSNLNVLGETAEGIEVRSMFCVWQTLGDGQTHLQVVGRSFDQLAQENGQIKIRKRVAVFDNELIPGSIVYPI